MADAATAPATTSDPSIVVDDLHVTYRLYGGRRVKPQTGLAGRIKAVARGTVQHVGAVTEVQALRGVSFVAHHGEAIGIIGRNGSGKSTLLRAVAGLITPTSGEVYVGGQTALLGVSAALNANLTGERNIVLGGLALGLTPEQVQERFDDVVDFAGIGDFVYLPMKAYSSGMAARLRFAISASATPDILMIDEALATGDADFRERSKAKIDEIREDAGTVFLVSHSDSTIRKMCTRALWLDRGRVLADGPVDEVCDAYRDAPKTPPKKRKGATGTAPPTKPSGGATGQA